MKTWRLTGSGAGSLRFEQEDTPPPGPGEVQVRIKAAAINYRDLGVAEGVYAAAPNLIPFSDGAGTVVAAGSGVADFATGDEVVSCFYENWQAGPGTPENHARSFGSERDGMLAELVNLPATGLVRKPASLSHAEASTMTCAGLTAWSALFTEARLQAGQHVVIQGTGGVAIFALQFAIMAGATATVISSSDEKLERARAMGADQVVNYRGQPDWQDAVMDFTGGRGAEAIVELGGAETLQRSLGCVAMDGTIAIIGFLSGFAAPIMMIPVIARRARIHGITVGHREDMRTMLRAVEMNGIKPVIDRTYPLADARQAYADLPKGQHFGKLVVDCT